jgi:hypothetical protein
MKTWLCTIVVTVAVLLTIIFVYPHANTTFDVTAEAESVTFTPLANIGQEWRMDRVRLRRTFDDTGTVLDGTLALSDSVKVLIERKSLGPLRLELEPLHPRATDALLGTFTPDQGPPRRPPRECVRRDSRSRSAGAGRTACGIVRRRRPTGRPSTQPDVGTKPATPAPRYRDDDRVVLVPFHELPGGNR